MFMFVLFYVAIKSFKSIFTLKKLCFFLLKQIPTLLTGQGAGDVQACWGREAGLPEQRWLTGEGPRRKNTKAALSTAGAEPAGSRQGRPVPVPAMSHSDECRPLFKNNEKPSFFTLY